MTLAQMRGLDRERISVREAAEILAVTKGEIIDSIVSRLDGLDIAEEDKDTLRKALLPVFYSLMRDINKRALSVLSDDERKTFLSLLGRVNQKIKTEYKDS